MASMSLTKMGVAFILVVMLFTVFGVSYTIVSLNGYDTSGINESLFVSFGNQTDTEEFVNETSDSVRSITGDSGIFDVIGGLINLGIGSVKTVIRGGDAIISGSDKIIGSLGADKVIRQFVVAVIAFILMATFLFAIVLGRRDRID